MLTLSLMGAAQEISDHTALATSSDLGQLAAKRFHRSGRAVLAVLLVALVVANVFNTGADLVAIGSSMQLLMPVGHGSGPSWREPSSRRC
jgi:Mn2+/Fe2+ NRAMP family transporter